MAEKPLQFDPGVYSKAVLADVDAVCDEFEDAWMSGASPRIEDIVSRVSPDGQRITTAQLIRVELELIRADGGEPDPAAYLQRFPDFHEVITEQCVPAPESLHTAGDSTAGALSRSPTLSPPEVPQQLGRYRIERELGHGGMGTVYLAHDTTLDREVALKIPRFGDHATDELIERFYREARSMAAIKHPNLCAIHDVAQVDGVHCLTMEYVEGEPLAQRRQSASRFSQAEAAGLVVKLSRAVQLAHDAGVVHRDLKPGNIMLDRHDEPVIMDFGLARRSKSSDATLTTEGVIVGSPAYMAPEQIGENSDDIGPHSDVYSLGVILYELVSGRTPYVGSAMSVLGQLGRDDIPPLREIHSDTDPVLNDICMQALARDRVDRFSSAAEFAEQLESWLAARPAADSSNDASAPDLATGVQGDSALPAAARPLETGTGTQSRQAPAASSVGTEPNRRLAAGVIGLVLLAALSVFVFKTPKQIVTVTVPDGARLDVVVKQRGEVVEVLSRDRGWTARIKEGMYELAVRTAGSDHGTTFEIEGGDTLHVSPHDGQPVTIVVKAIHETQPGGAVGDASNRTKPDNLANRRGNHDPAVRLKGGDTVNSDIVDVGYEQFPKIDARPLDGAAVFASSRQSLGTSSAEIAVGDVDGDGDIDALTVSSTDGSGSVWANDGHGRFELLNTVPMPDQARDVNLSDVDCDGDPDLIAVTLRGDGTSIWFNDGTGSLTRAETDQAPLNGNSVTAADFDGDGDPDLAVARGDFPSEIWMNDGAGRFTNSGQRLGDGLTFELPSGDLDGDGDVDLFACNKKAAGEVWTNDGTGRFSISRLDMPPVPAQNARLADVDHDGDLDVVVTCYVKPTLLLINDGTGKFSISRFARILKSAGKALLLPSTSLAVADFDGNGTSDLLIGCRSQTGMRYPCQLLLRDEHGGYQTQLFGSQSNAAVAVADFDGDGDIDAFLANKDGSTDQVWLNRGADEPVTSPTD